MAARRSNSHRHRKFSRYTGDVSQRRRRSSIGLWRLIPASALLAFALALALGSFLGSQVEEPSQSTPEDTKTEASAFPPPVSESIESIDGVLVSLSGIYDNTYYEVAAQIPSEATAITLSMFSYSGFPLYYSEVAERYGLSTGELTLKNIFRYPAEKGLYVSVPFESKALSGSDVLIQEIEMINELCLAGADEVIIKCQRGALDDEFLLSLAEYITEIKKASPEMHVGFVISAEEAPATKTVDKICDYADFCAVDLSAISDAEAFDSEISPAFVNILRYNMRILMKGGSEESLDSRYGVLDRLGIKNRQILSK